jgi:hypothetical protein
MYCKPKRLNVLIDWIPFLVHISEVRTSYIGRDFPQSLQVRDGMVPTSGSETSFAHHSHFRRFLVEPVLLTAQSNKESTTENTTK